MKLIVGLGNYPPKYEHTRHNFGFLAVDALSEKYGFSEWKDEKKFFAKCAYGEIKGEKTILCKPQTFMNLSGKAVLPIVNFYKIPNEKILVISDDLDQEFGAVRFREKGSSGGQKGIADIIRVLGSENFSRLKFGINNDQRNFYKTEDFVTSKFSKEELQQVHKILDEGFKKLEEKL